MAAFNDRAIGKARCRISVHDHTNFSGLQRLLNGKYMEESLALQSLNVTEQSAQNFETSLKDTFEALCEIRVYNLKFHLLGQVAEHFDYFVWSEVLDSPS